MPNDGVAIKSDEASSTVSVLQPRRYQREMLEESLRRNIIIALDTGSGKTYIAILRMKLETERESRKVSWFLAPTVALARQQKNAIERHLPASVGLISGANEPDQWKDAGLWLRVLDAHRVIVSTHDVLLNALRHGYVRLGADISLLVFDEAHHATDKHAYNLIMREFYFELPSRTFLDGKDSSLEVRPMILGLTASPIFGGDAERALRQIEFNLDSTICTPLLNRQELEGFVYRPQFKSVIYAEPEYQLEGIPPSTSLRSLKKVISLLNIEEDPWVLDRRSALRRLEPGPERDRIDQRLSRAINKQDTFTHKGLRDFERAADEICSDLGAWAADWYIQQVCEQAAGMGAVFSEFSFTWSEGEREYLLKNLACVEIAPMPDDDPEDIVRRSSDKVERLIDVLLEEKVSLKSGIEYRGLVFVTRRDAVLALTEVLARHPRTAHEFSVGSLLGESGNSRRRSFLDITRRLLRQPANKTLDDFSIGELNLIVATAVAEEGLDIQACCNVVRWDIPANMVSWVQSRGRARQEISTFVLMFSNSVEFQPTVRRWEELEKEMTKLYHTKRELLGLLNYDLGQPMDEDEDDVFSKLRFTVETTSAVLTGNSAIEHIAHFCSILPYSGLGHYAPLFDIDPPDYPLEWHANRGPLPPNDGPFGCTLTLPRLVDPRFRKFSTPQVHKTKVAARRHVAFQAYLALYENGLLNDHLLPLTSALEPELESEVRTLLKEVERREGTALVSSQMDPWHVHSGEGSSAKNERWWHSAVLEVDGLPPLRMFTQTALPTLRDDEFPVTYTRESHPIKVRVSVEEMPISATATAAIAAANGEEEDDGGIIARARAFTRRLFWPLYGSRMKWDQIDFLHLFIPVDESPTVWDERRNAFASDPSSQATGYRSLFAPFPWFEQRYGQANDISIISGTGFSGKAYQFIRWHDEPATMEEKLDLVRRYVRVGRGGDDKEDDDDSYARLEITYPLIEARSFVKRNLLTPMPPNSKGMDAVSQKPVLLLKDFSLVTLTSAHEAHYALMVPSIIRHLQMVSTVSAMRDALFAGTPLTDISLDLLLTATTAPAAQERNHYQRLETLGDTVLKYTVSIQLLSAHPLWHEGYLARRKDHAVSNANLAKMAIQRKLYKWIIRDIFIPKRWKPRLMSDPVALISEETPSASPVREMKGLTEKQKRRVNVSRNLSTKVLADVVEALIGAAYIHGGFALGTECMKTFDLGLSWNPLPECVDVMYSRVTEFERYPTQIPIVESILGYTFCRKAIAVEALTHSSYQSNLATISYERMEFLGDAVLDMLVTDFLYHAPGKEYSPGKIHMIKTAVVNAHFLAMLCLRASTELPTVMPSWSQHDGVTMTEDAHRVHLWQCLLHSSVSALDEQRATFARWERPGGRDDIEAMLAEGRAFPWSALTSLQAPKFLSDMFESLLGAVFLDSRGDLDVTREVLRRLGHWEILERIVGQDMDVRHPVSRLYLWAGQHHEKVKCGIPERNGDKVSCSVFWGDYEVAKAEDEWRGRISQESVRFAAAEKAITVLENPVSLLGIWLAQRNRSVEYIIEQEEGVLRCSAIVDGTVIATVQSQLQDMSSLSSSEEEDEDVKRAASTEVLKKLEAPVHWLAFLSAQHHIEVNYQIYEEEEEEGVEGVEGVKVCSVYLDGYEAGRVEYPNRKGSGVVLTDDEMMVAVAKEAIEMIEQRVIADSTCTDIWEGVDWAGSTEDEGMDGWMDVT
ncbi:hypothetical protein B0F90DRAFT_1727667 [Multifurca ochricompacta]|uniref:P-loop containing nucleoside triphosphate hydrolase protein n=1 Tax=Multifurca ochricompacta TaxID=376703 RepID=A0AAD4QKB2_9AGAM|nr:hypothetical protein B0F90DRAFT_1727667 [Multifurca ochricompacta]